VFFGTMKDVAHEIQHGRPVVPSRTVFRSLSRNGHEILDNAGFGLVA
jgi:hypothetical protein